VAAGGAGAAGGQAADHRTPGCEYVLKTAARARRGDDDGRSQCTWYRVLSLHTADDVFWVLDHCSFRVAFTSRSAAALRENVLASRRLRLTASLPRSVPDANRGVIYEFALDRFFFSAPSGLFCVTLQRLDLAAEIYHIRERRQ
jgi:hypothetical protein